MLVGNHGSLGEYGRTYGALTPSSRLRYPRYASGFVSVVCGLFFISLLIGLLTPLCPDWRVVRSYNRPESRLAIQAYGTAGTYA